MIKSQYTNWIYSKSEIIAMQLGLYETAWIRHTFNDGTLLSGYRIPQTFDDWVEENRKFF